MKKVLAMVAVFVMMPLAAFAKTAVSDSDLGAVTGQAGVTIAADITIPTLNIGVLSWGDADGVVSAFGGVGTAGYVGVTGVAVANTHIGIDPAAILADPINYSAVQAISIDVATAADGSAYDILYGAGLAPNPTFVHIGLGTIEVTVASIDATVKIGDSKDLGSANAMEIGTLYVADLQLTIGANSYVDILAH
ncbi:MAG: DUF6160 family protein [Geobacteraceae bacterium]